jgi:hypothetical protein
MITLFEMRESLIRSLLRFWLGKFETGASRRRLEVRRKLALDFLQAESE